MNPARIGAWARLLLIALLLGGCASPAPLPAQSPALALPLQLHVQRQQAADNLDWLLVIQAEPDGLRWSLLDPLGVPLARQRLVDGQWQNDGLLPPNPEARELFAALLFALSPGAELARAYPGLDWQTDDQQRSLRQGDRHWQVHYRQALRFELLTQGELRYSVAPLVQESRP
ncbi:MAG: DUF3261 domain-containing protein [Pseudomonas sp.]|uniref:DUF3261 domain-containing protein n=1 Tax=Pseudomonas sp. TaxID=306 RepID=UPI003394398E